MAGIGAVTRPAGGCDRCRRPIEGEVVELREDGHEPDGRLCRSCYARLLTRREIEAVRVEKAGDHREVVVLELPELDGTRNH